MSDHLLHIIDRAKKEIAQDTNSLALLTYYKAGVDLAEWGNILDLRDLCYIESCQEWRTLIRVFSRMESKYLKLWVLAGQPDDAETWLKKLNISRRDSVGHDYWDTLNAEVDYGYPLKEMIT